MMELYIETLTGAAFELRVSPFESIQSVKAKIQRLEGIPISQQHLIWQAMELDDEYCLHDYDIHSGATLKLVLAMRGGPINTRRVPIEDSSLVEYMESTPDELIDKLPGSNRQVTLLVFREGDQLNFFRVVDRGDGTLTPLSESLSAASMYNMYDEEEDAESGDKERLEENARIKEKMSSLRKQMDNLNISKKSKSTAPVSAATSSSNPSRLQAVHSSPTTALNRNLCLPPVITQKSVSLHPSIEEHSYATNKSQSAHTSTLTELTIPHPPAESRSSKQELSQRLHHTNLLTTPHVPASGVPVGSNIKALSARPIRRSDSEKTLGLKKTDSIIKAIPSTGLKRAKNGELGSAATASTGSGYPKRKDVLSLDKLQDTFRGVAPTSCEAGTNTTGSATSLYARRASSRQHELRAASRQQPDLTLETIKDTICSQRITLESLSLNPNEAKAMSGYIQQASLEKLGSSNISLSNFSPVRTRKSSSNMYHTIDGIGSPNGANNLLMLPENVEDIAGGSKLPPVKSKKKAGKSTKRCFLCAKKTGLATSYMCRCGNNFCAAHRYAELHDCTFDYKTEGRQLLEQNNPVVSAPKLPKI